MLGLTEDDIVFSAARLFFAYGLGNANYLPFSVGASVILNSDPPKPESVFEHMTAFPADDLLRHPHALRPDARIQGEAGQGEGAPPDPDAPHEFSSVRLCFSAGEALPPDLITAGRQSFGLDILDGLGSTEMLHIFISQPSRATSSPGATGKPVPGYELRLVDDEGKDVPKGEIGTLMVKGGSAAQQYWRKREKTRLTMQGEWINTGDKYYEDADGYYWCAGRGDDMLKVGGIWVSPVEVENCIMEHPAVFEVAVVGHNDEKGLAKPKAFVVLRDGKRGPQSWKRRLNSGSSTGWRSTSIPAG